MLVISSRVSGADNRRLLNPLSAMSRLLFLACCLLFTRLVGASTVSDSTNTLPAPAATISLVLAGLPAVSALPDSRVYFTVQADVFRDGELFIAAGARAKGRLVVDCTLDSVACYVVLPEAVQTTVGTMQALEPMFVRLTVDGTTAAWQQPFKVEIARTMEEMWAEMGRKARP